MAPLHSKGSPLDTCLQVKAVRPSRLPRIAAKSSVGRLWMDMVSKAELLPQPNTDRRVFEGNVMVSQGQVKGRD